MCWLRLVALSRAVTFRMPLASISKVTSTWGTPRGAGGIPSRTNLPKDLLSLAIGRSPWSTLISTCGWLSLAVEKIWLFSDGIVVLRSINGVATPPNVSTERVNGVTSRSKMSFTSPPRTPAWIAAPIATTSSGFTPRWGSLSNSFRTASWTAGIRVIPPTRTTSSIAERSRSASFNAWRTGPKERSIRSAVSCSSFARVKFITKCLGPLASAVI